MKPALIAANWKMYKTVAGALAYFERWLAMPAPEGRETAFFPPFPLLAVAGALLPEGQALGAQNCHEADEGAFTGEVSCALLKDMGCTYVLAGHSERRHVFGEPDARIAAKVASALKHGLRPVLCVGETLGEREAGRTLDVVLGQLDRGLGAPPQEGFDVAYEPVWAIGTGRVAKPGDAQEVHAAIRRWLTGRGVSSGVRILYGGSVKPDNAGDLLGCPDVHGLLVGGASLDPVSFHAIATAPA
jgi:triosephosphate isomerase